MRIALVHYVADVCGSNPVCESLNGIHEALESVQSSKTHNDVKQTLKRESSAESSELCALPTFI
jgi:hypothetical protein